MGEVKSAFEKAMEKIKEIQGLGPEEKEEMRDREKLRSVLAAFYKGDLKKDEIWEQLKGTRPALLKEAQENMVDSLRIGNMPEEFQMKKDGILAIEALKEKQNMAAIEHSLNSVQKVQREYSDIRQRAVEELRAAIEENPKLRMRPVRTPDGRTVLQATPSVDEAVQARVGEFLTEHEKRYEGVFLKAIERLKKEIR
jgi:hypothetical protein